MGLDIRLPIGFLFITLGMILGIFGVFSDSTIYSRSFGINVNLYWGTLLLGFGIAMAIFGQRGAAAARSRGDSAGSPLDAEP